MIKHYANIKVRLRQDSGMDKPEYTEKELINLLTQNKITFDISPHGTIFLLDDSMEQKIVAIIDKKETPTRKISKYLW